VTEALRIRKGSLVVLCGPAGSGKSTWAEDRFPAPAVVSSDDCRGRVCDDPTDQSVSAAAFALFRFTLRQRLALGRTSVADSTALEPEARRSLLGIAREAGVDAVLVLMDLPEDVCRQRNDGRDRRVPAAVLRNQIEMTARARRAVRREGWSRIHRFETAEAAGAARVEMVPREAAGPGR